MSYSHSIDQLTNRRDKLKLLLEIRDLTNELGLAEQFAAMAIDASPSPSSESLVAASAFSLASARAEAQGSWNPHDVEEDNEPAVDEPAVDEPAVIEKAVLKKFQTDFDIFFQCHRSNYTVVKYGKERLQYGASALIMEAFNLTHPELFRSMPAYEDHKPFYKQLAIKASQKAANLVRTTEAFNLVRTTDGVK